VCPLLQNADDGVDVPRLRLVQRLLEIALQRKTSEEVMQALLPETAAPLRAEHIGIWEATPTWQLRWQYARPGTRINLEITPRTLLNEILDHQAGGSQAPSGLVPTCSAPVSATSIGPIACCWRCGLAKHSAAPIWNA
jgi:hypothetical protein